MAAVGGRVTAATVREGLGVLDGIRVRVASRIGEGERTSIVVRLGAAVSDGVGISAVADANGISAGAALSRGSWPSGVNVGKGVNCGGVSPPNDERNSILNAPRQYINKAINVAPATKLFQIFLSVGRLPNQSSIFSSSQPHP